jgi:hypothetical protein
MEGASEALFGRAGFPLGEDGSMYRRCRQGAASVWTFAAIYSARCQVLSGSYALRVCTMSAVFGPKSFS